MSNGSVCSTKINVGNPHNGGIKVSYKTHDVYAWVGGTARRVRHHKQLPSTETCLVVCTPKTAKVDRDHATALLEAALVDNSTISDLPIGSHIGLSADGLKNGAHIPAGRVLTGEGGWGFKDASARELMMMASSERGGDGFYETAVERTARRQRLVSELCEGSPVELLELVRTLRGQDRARTAAVMIAVDAAAAGASNARALFEAALQRPDEPGLALRYFMDIYPGRSLPQALRKGVGDAAVRLYSETGVLKYDHARRVAVHDRSQIGNPVRFADVVRLCHPSPSSSQQSALFKALVTGDIDKASLPRLAARSELAALSAPLRLARLEEEARLTLEAVRAGHRSPSVFSRFSAAELSSLAGQPRQGISTAKAAATAAENQSRAIRTSAEFAEVRRDVRRAEHRRAVAYSAVHRAETAVAGASSSPHLSELKQALEDRRSELRTAVTHCSEVRSSPEAYALSAALSNARTTAVQARAALAAAQSTPGVVPAPVWEILAPQMSISETLTNLGSMGRSGVSSELRSVIESRLRSDEAWNGSSAKISDVLRAVRGVTLAEHPERAAHQYGEDGSWTSAEPSSWEPVFEEIASRAVAAQLPELKSRVLVMVDGSGSMLSEVATRRNDTRSEGYRSLSRAEVATFSAAAIASRALGDNVDVVVYDTSYSKVDPASLSDGVLASTRSTASQIRGGGTNTFGMMQEAWHGHDLVVILTDEQTSWTLDQPHSATDARYRDQNNNSSATQVPSSTRIITVNLDGGGAAHLPSSDRFVRISGFSEQMYEEIARIDAEVSAEHATNSGN